MASFRHLSSMYDVSLKPRLIRTLLKEQVPNEKQPLRSPSAIADVVSMIRTHKLLSESVSESCDPEIAESWKSAVDDWVDRLLTLVSSNMPDKCWVGVCLLGVTCQECSSERFLSSYSDWFHKLLTHIQLPGDSHLVKVASVASVSDLFTRLAGFPNIVKDGISHAGKLILPCVKLLSEDISEVISEEAVYLLCTLLTFYPSSIRHHYESVEDAIVLNILSGKSSVHLLEKYAHCLALLPKSRGDEETWSLLMQKILLLLNSYLNETFEGFEEDHNGNDIAKLFVPRGKDSLPFLGHHKILGETPDKAARRSKSPMHSVSSLMVCCYVMLASNYPVQVNVPVQPLFALIRRVLRVDGSLSETLLPFMTAMQQEFICSQLPVLHSCSLELLSAVIKAVRSQLLPHAPNIVRLLTEYICSCGLPELRIKVYSIMKILVMSMGSGLAVYIAQDIISNAFADLDLSSNDSSSTTQAYAKAPTEASPRRKKRKHASTTKSAEEQGVKVEVPLSYTTIAVKIAALEALESLLTVGGALRSESWRSKIDLLLITIAINACKGRWSREQKNVFMPNQPVSTWSSFQLAALRTLLASLLSPGRVRPMHLAQALELFCEGKKETGTKVAEFCAQALLALEILMHPRALPLVDCPAAGTSFDRVNREFQGNIWGQKHSTAHTNGFLRAEPTDFHYEDDDLFVSWQMDDDVTADAVTEPTKNMNECKVASETIRPGADELPHVEEPCEKRIPQTGEQRPAASGCDVEMEENHNDAQKELQKVPEVLAHEATTVPASSGNSLVSKIELRNTEMASSQDVMSANSGEPSTMGKTNSATTLDSEREKGFLSELEAAALASSYPDIVDDDTDTDSE